MVWPNKLAEWDFRPPPVMGLYQFADCLGFADYSVAGQNAQLVEARYQCTPNLTIVPSGI